jgi:hypothetical protein
MSSHDSDSISLQVTVYLAEEDLDTFFAALGSVFNKIASEPYCTLFEVYQSQEDKGQILMLKNWYSTSNPRSISIRSDQLIIGRLPENGWLMYLSSPC